MVLLVPSVAVTFRTGSVNGKGPRYREMPNYASLRVQETATGEGSVVTCGLAIIQLRQEGSQTPSESHNVSTRNRCVYAGTKLLDEAKTRGLFPVPQKGPHLQGQSLGPQLVQNTVPSSNELIHVVVNFLEGGVALQRVIHWDGGVRVL